MSEKEESGAALCTAADIDALKAWLRANSNFVFLREDLIEFITQKTKGYKLCIGEDNSNYDSQKCNNGGSYGFWTNLNWEDHGIYYISHHTTADFEYCRACGSFNGHDPESCGYERIDLRTKESKIRTMKEAEQRLLDELKWLRADIETINTDD